MKTGSEAIRALAMQIPAFRQKLSDGWYQVRVAIPEPLRFIEPRETETRTMHALEEYGVMQVKLNCLPVLMSRWKMVP